MPCPGNQSQDDPQVASSRQTVFKEIARDDGRMGAGNYHVLVVDEDGVTKASSRERYPLEQAVQLAARVPMPVACPGELRECLNVDKAEVQTHASAVHIEV